VHLAHAAAWESTKDISGTAVNWRFYTTKAFQALESHMTQKSFVSFLLNPANGYVHSKLTDIAAIALKTCRRKTTKTDARRKSEGAKVRVQAHLISHVKEAHCGGGSSRNQPVISFFCFANT
jgi:hypothetical protein